MNPLKSCKLRTAGLASAKSATFGMVRKNADGTPRAHQGIDLQADEGTAVYAIADGVIEGVNRAENGYGLTLTLKFWIDGKAYYAFYAHLDDVFVKAGQLVKDGGFLAITGDSGNAKGMTTIAKGGHLHIEIRETANVGIGLAGRLDPLKFIKLDKES